MCLKISFLFFIGKLGGIRGSLYCSVSEGFLICDLPLLLPFRCGFIWYLFTHAKKIKTSWIVSEEVSGIGRNMPRQF
jgi:hypothetical protein